MRNYTKRKGNLRSCENCFYWCKSDTYKGECRAKSPHLVEGLIDTDTINYARVFPETSHDDWCGDHRDLD